MNIPVLANLSQRYRFFGIAGKAPLIPLIFLTLFFSNTLFAQPPGSLAMKLFVIETTGVPEKADQFDQYFEEHIAHQVSLEKSGTMFAAGPLYNSDEATDGPPSAGMILIRADSFEEAKEIADADPMHTNGIRTYTIRQWSMNEGTFNLRVNFSDQSIEFK